jgi:hypothetical protein
MSQQAVFGIVCIAPPNGAPGDTDDTKHATRRHIGDTKAA